MKNIEGERFNNLIVIRRVEDEARRSRGYYICKCDCGKETETRKDRLLSGWTKSCGCLFLKVKTTHGNTAKGKSTREYHSWRAMRERCLNPNKPYYENYGGRGIKVCDRWKNSFENFLADMGSRPEKTSLDRINSDGNYEPSNCRWGTIQEQNKNRRPRKSGLIYKSKKRGIGT